MPPGTVDISVDGEWSFAQTLRHLVAVTDLWLGKAMVSDFLATLTPEELTATHRNPHNPDHQVTTLSCLHTIIRDEWEHQRYAVRDLDAIERDR